MNSKKTRSNWQPKADLQLLRLRAEVYEKIRHFFRQRQVLEVDTPILSQASTPDPNIDSFETTYFSSSAASSGGRRYLSTSPEFHMKRLLAAGSGSIYQLCHVFRQAEQGSRHNPEFTMLEWYRVEWDYQQLMTEVAELVCELTGEPLVAEVVSYQDAFLEHLELDPLSVSSEELEVVCRQYGLVISANDRSDKDLLLDFLMSQAIQPKLGKDKLTFIHRYPASQSAYAELSSDNNQTAQRFELFYRGMELANGYQELLDAGQQQLRFEKQNQSRSKQKKDSVNWDSYLVQALEHGLPYCSGVALGLDRLIQIICNLKNIEDVLAFPFNRA